MAVVMIMGCVEERTKWNVLLECFGLLEGSFFNWELRHSESFLRPPLPFLVGWVVLGRIRIVAVVVAVGRWGLRILLAVVVVHRVVVVVVVDKIVVVAAAARRVAVEGLRKLGQTLLPRFGYKRVWHCLRRCCEAPRFLQIRGSLTCLLLFNLQTFTKRKAKLKELEGLRKLPL